MLSSLVSELHRTFLVYLRTVFLSFHEVRTSMEFTVFIMYATHDISKYYMFSPNEDGVAFS